MASSQDPRPVTRGLLASAAGGCGWPLSGAEDGLEARGGAKRVRERAGWSAGPHAPALVSRARESDELGRSTERPAEASSSWWWRQVPYPDRFGALLGLDLAAAVGLLGGLSGHAERSTDLGPGDSVAACSCGQKISCICECVLGVSHGFQGLQGPLWTALGATEALDRSTDAVARCGAFLGRHVNGYCPGAPTGSARYAQFRLRPSTCDTSFPNSASMRVGPCDFDSSAFRYGPTTEKKRPRAAPTAGVVDGIRCN